MFEDTDRRVSVIVFFRFGQFFIWDKAWRFFLVIIALFAVSPSLTDSLSRPDVMVVSGEQLNECIDFFRQNNA